LREDSARRELAEIEVRKRNEELNLLNSKLMAAQEHLVQSEKLASIGQLAAGVAHEINNPIGYIFSNFGSLENYLASMFEMLAAYEGAEGENPTPDARTSIRPPSSAWS
jgi:phosphoglycerate-specific signal transduction histidine kinase